jgi:hypothetical protein
MDKWGLKLTCALCLAVAPMAACTKTTKTVSAPPPQAVEPAAAPDPDDPVYAHLRARKQVDPRDTRPYHEYTTKPTAEEIERETQPTQTASLSKFKTFNAHTTDPALETIQRAPVAPQKPIRTVSAPQQQAEIIAPVPGVASSVMGVRIGEHPGKVRVVLDVSAAAQFKANIDNTERLLVVDLPQSAWPGNAQGVFGANALVKGYSATPSANGGVSVLIQLKQPARLTMSTAMQPNEVYGHRIVFDVAPL